MCVCVWWVFVLCGLWRVMFVECCVCELLASFSVYVCVLVHVCVCVCVCARAHVCVCARACMPTHLCRLHLHIF